jgi:hypothetical protein
MPNTLRFVPRLAVMVAFTLPVAAQQQQAKRSQFVITKGNDTVAVELFSRQGNALTSEIYQTNGPRTQYTMDLKPDSSISHVEFTRVTQNNQSIGISIFFLDSTVKAQMSAQGQTEQFEFPSRKGGAIPMLVMSFALCEQIVHASHLGVGQSATYTAIRLGAGDTTQLAVNRFHKDSVSFAMQGAQLKAALDAKGEIVSGVHLGQGWTITRKP